jgi:hypothetical protein
MGTAKGLLPRRHCELAAKQSTTPLNRLDCFAGCAASQ